MNLIIPTLIYGQITSKIGWTAVLDLDDFSRSAAQIDDIFDDMSSASARFDKIMSGVGVGIGVGVANAAASMGRSIVGAINDSIEMAKIFEQQMAKVRTLIQITDTEFDKLGKGVLAISERLPQTVENLSDALFTLTSAGVKTKDVLSVLELASKAATAGFTDVSTVASLGVGTLNAYGLEVSDLNRVYDIFFETARIGVTDFSSLASSIGSVLPSAKDLGVSLEELGAAFAAATKGGISTSEVATGLVATFRNLAARREDLEKLANVKIFDAGEFRGLVPIFNDLSETLGKLSREGRVKLLDKIGFDAEASKIISTFTNDMDTFNESLEATTKSAGVVGKALGTALSTTENQLSILGNRIKTLSLGVLQPFVGLLGDAAGGINRIFDGFDASRIVSEFETLQTSTESQIRQLETLRRRYEDVTTTLRETSAGTAENTRASVEQKTIIEAIQRILPEAVVAYDDYGKAISISTKHINDFITAQRQMLGTELVSRLKQMTDQITGLSRAIRRAREDIQPFEERLAALETIGRDAFINIAKAADATDISWREGVIATLSDFTSDSGTLSDFLTQMTIAITSSDDAASRAELAGKGYDFLWDTATRGAKEAGDEIKTTNVNLGATQQALESIVGLAGFDDLLREFVLLNHQVESTTEQAETMQTILARGLKLGLADSAEEVRKVLEELAQAIVGLGEIAPNIVKLPSIQTEGGDVKIAPKTFEDFGEARAKLVTDLKRLELDLAKTEEDAAQRSVTLAQKRLEGLRALKEEFAEVEKAEKQLMNALLDAELELAEAKIELLERTQSERERIENETTRNQEEAARTRVKLFADEINAELKLLDGLSGQDKTVAIRVLSEVGGFSGEKIERVLSDVEGGVLSAGDVLKLRANIIQEALNALDQNLDRQTKDTSAFVGFQIMLQGRIADAGRQAQAERIKRADEASQLDDDRFDRQLKRQSQADLEIERKAQEGREAEERFKEEATEKGLVALQRLAKSQEENAIEQVEFLRDTNQISLEDYRGFLQARLNFLKAEGKAETDEWRNVARQLHGVDQDILANAEDAARDLAQAYKDALRELSQDIEKVAGILRGLSPIFNEISGNFSQMIDDMAGSLDFLSESLRQVQDELSTLGAIELGAKGFNRFFNSVRSIVRLFQKEVSNDVKNFNEDLDQLLSRLPENVANQYFSTLQAMGKVTESELPKILEDLSDFVDRFELGQDQASSLTDAFVDGLLSVLAGDPLADVREQLQRSLDQMVIDAIIASSTNLARVQPVIEFYVKALNQAFEDGILSTEEAGILKAVGGQIQALFNLADAEIQGRVEQAEKDLGFELSRGQSKLGDQSDRLTPSTSFGAATEPQINQTNSLLARQTQHLFSIEQSGLEMVAILNRRLNNGNVVPVAQPLAPPPQRITIDLVDRIQIEIGGQLVMQADRIEDIDFDAIADHLHERLKMRRAGIGSGRAR